MLPDGHDPKQLQALIEATAADAVPLSFRPMFGGIMGYADGRPFASLSNRGLALKLTGAAQDELRALPGALPLQYNPDDPPSKSYTLLPAAMLDDRELLRTWIVRSAQSVSASSASAKGRRR